jgi:hypothetical protein
VYHRLEENQISMMEVPADFRGRCKHIAAAREFWCDMWLKIIAEKQEAKKHET